MHTDALVVGHGELHVACQPRCWADRPSVPTIVATWAAKWVETLEVEKLTVGSDVAYVAGLARVRAAAGVLITDEPGRVLVVHPTYKDICELPGGMLEHDESPRVACERELREELGFVPPVGGLLCVDWVPPCPPWDGGLMFVFDGGTLSPDQIARIRLPAEELDRFDFVPVDRLESVLVPRLARRVLACLPMRGRGGLYLEDGTIPAR